MIQKILIAVLLSSTMAACSYNDEPEEEIKPVASAPIAVVEPEPIVVEEEAPTPVNRNSVYFKFNKHNVEQEYSSIIKANADFLRSNPDSKAHVIGHTDDVGSVEYNLALGQKRAHAVKKTLVAHGAPAKHIETTSKGKLASAYSNETQDGRAKNRRVDIMYNAGQPKGYSLDNQGLPVVDNTVYDGNVLEGIE